MQATPYMGSFYIVVSVSAYTDGDAMTDQDERTCWFIEDLHPDETQQLHRKPHPKVSGKLRLLRENYGPRAGIKTTPMPDLAPPKGSAYHAELWIDGVLVSSATGTYGYQQERIKTPHEMAETRAIARCLRFAGFAIDGTSSEEMDAEGGKAPTAAPKSREPTGRCTLHLDDEPTETAAKRLEQRGWSQEDGEWVAELTKAEYEEERKRLNQFGQVAWHGD